MWMCSSWCGEEEHIRPKLCNYQIDHLQLGLASPWCRWSSLPLAYRRLIHRWTNNFTLWINLLSSPLLCIVLLVLVIHWFSRIFAPYFSVTLGQRQFEMFHEFPLSELWASSPTSLSSDTSFSILPKQRSNAVSWSTWALASWIISRGCWSHKEAHQKARKTYKKIEGINL